MKQGEGGETDEKISFIYSAGTEQLYLGVFNDHIFFPESLTSVSITGLYYIIKTGGRFLLSQTFTTCVPVFS